MLILASMAGRASAQDISCPEGFQRIPSGAACAAANLAGADGTFSGLTAPLTSARSCPEGFERPPGVNFCVATNLTVNAVGALPILERQTSRFCPEGFHRQTGSAICVASNLTVTMQGSNATLLGPTQECPVGFYRPVGSTVCVAGNQQGEVHVLPLPIAAKCPPGYFRPPGVAICLPKTVVYASTVPLNVPVPTGACPPNWHRPPGVKFCVPSHERVPPGSTLVFGYTPNPCPAGKIEVWFDVPVYDEETGLFVVDYIPTRFCVPEGLEPAG
jgi:hypothetical protein